jgi:uncharacterized protein (TIRG00374 family)
MLLKLFIAFLIFLILIKTFNLELTTLTGEIKAWHCLAMAAGIPLTLSSFFSANRWQVFLRLNSIDEPLTKLWKISLISQFQGLVLPSSQGGDVFRMLYIERRHPDKRGKAGSTVIIERMIGLLVLCTLTLSALPFLPASGNYVSLVATVGIITSIAAAAQFLLTSKKLHILYSKRAIKNPFIASVLRYIEKLHTSTANFPYRKALASSLLYIFSYQISLILIVYLVFRAFGYDIPFVQHFALYPVIAILTMVPITIGGFGVREGFFVYFYGLLDVPTNIAVGASLANYTIMVLVPAAFGGIIYFWDTVQETRLRR